MTDKRTLFHKGSTGKIYSWTVWTDNDIIYTEHGTDDGGKVLTPKKCSSKNVGKKNETSPTEQATKEAEAMYTKKLEGKYRESIDDACETQINPMLAKDFFKNKDKLIYPIEEQPKLDGARCIAYWEDGKVQLMSRGGKKLLLPHIEEQVESFLPKWAILDGEIYNHDISFQQTMRLIKKLRSESDNLDYCVYDSINQSKTKMEWSERNKMIKDIIPDDLDNIKKLESTICSTEKEALEAAAEYVSQGYEGGIARTLGGLYKFGGRSKDLLKIKTFVDKEYKIVGFTKYEMRLVDNGKPKMIDCVRWTCVTPEGKEFNVVPKGTAYERNEMLKDAPHSIGKMLTVKYFELSEDRIPRFPVGLTIRESSIQGE